VKVVPSYLLEPNALGVADIQTMLVDSGYYTADQLK
jgi:putative multiple sugar transport system substrate-binding protein